MRFQALIESLPRNDEQPGLEAPQKALTVEPATIPGFVAPEFEIIDHPEDAGVLLIEAAGAVGKSATAEAMADALQWPLVRAERAQVGSYSLSGLIHDALGYLGTYLQQIASGTAGIIVDSLDEAHFRAGTQNFLAFIENIEKISGRASSLPRPISIVLFSRSDTAEFVSLAFETEGIPLAKARLSFFNRDEATKFISSYMKRRFDETGRPDYNAPLASAAPWERLRDDRFLQVMKVVLRNQNVTLRTHWDESADFLGYAPVLIALAESLATTNPSAEKRRLASARADNEAALLLDIIDLILDRERQKFADQLLPKLQAVQSAADTAEVRKQNLYLPSEQAIRVIAHIQGDNALLAPPPSDLPASVRPTYESSATQFIADHPFVRGNQFASVIFGDYVRALVATSLEAAAALHHVPLPDAETVGPFFMTFVKVMCPNSRISESLVEPLMRSWAQEVELAGHDEAGTMITLRHDFNEVRFVRAAPIIGAEPDDVVFEVADLSGALQLRGPVRDVVITTEQGVILGTRSEPLSLGPNVIILAGELDIQAESLNIAWPEAEGQATVALGGSTITANNLTQVVEPKSNSFSLYFSEPPPKLRSYRRTLTVNGARHVPYEDYVALRAILGTFYSSVHFNGLSASRERIDNGIVRNSLDRLKILNRLIDKSMLDVSGDWYVLNTAKLGDIGISLKDVKSGMPSNAVLQFLAECRQP